MAPGLAVISAGRCRGSISASLAMMMACSIACPSWRTLPGKPNADRARQAAGDKDISVGGGADVIRQALRAGYVDELAISIAPVILGGGKRLFTDFTKSLDLENRGVRQSRFATFIEFAVKR